MTVQDRDRPDRPTAGRASLTAKRQAPFASHGVGERPRGAGLFRARRPSLVSLPSTSVRIVHATLSLLARRREAAKPQAVKSRTVEIGVLSPFSAGRATFALTSPCRSFVFETWRSPFSGNSIVYRVVLVSGSTGDFARRKATESRGARNSIGPSARSKPPSASISTPSRASSPPATARPQTDWSSLNSSRAGQDLELPRGNRRKIRARPRPERR